MTYVLIDIDGLLHLRNPTLTDVLWFIRDRPVQVFFDAVLKGVGAPHDWHPNNTKAIAERALYYFIDQFEQYNVVDEGLNFFSHRNVYDNTYTYLEYFINRIVARTAMMFNPLTDTKVYHLKDYQLNANALYVTDYALVDAEPIT